MAWGLFFLVFFLSGLVWFVSLSVASAAPQPAAATTPVAPATVLFLLWPLKSPPRAAHRQPEWLRNYGARWRPCAGASWESPRMAATTVRIVSTSKGSSVAWSISTGLLSVLGPLIRSRDLLRRPSPAPAPPASLPSSRLRAYRPCRSHTRVYHGRRCEFLSLRGSPVGQQAQKHPLDVQKLPPSGLSATRFGRLLLGGEG